VIGRSLIALAAAAAVVAIAGCGEQAQVTVYKQGKYQGKPDTQPWDNTPLAYSDAKWTKGDRAGWEEQIKQRTLGQNEDNRIYRQ
jgi:hypothetical protein